MWWLNFKRVFKTGFINFWRNGLVSAASIFVVVVTLLLFGSLILASAFLEATLSEVKERVDINVYFKPEAAEEEILALKKQIEGLPEVKSVEYLSREEVLERFRQTNKDNALIAETLSELPENPFGAVFNIKAREPSQYEGIAVFLSKYYKVEGLGVEPRDSIVDSVNYNRNKVVIDRLNNLIEATRAIGLALGLFLAITAVLVTFNTIRLAIYNAREEIEVMKLVGASPAYIRGPFIVEGIMYGAIAALIAMAALFPATRWLSAKTENFFGGLDLFAYYLDNFGELFAVLFISGIILGIASSFLAVRRHLKLV